MASDTIDQLIVNSPYREPEQHWSYERESRSFTLKLGRRPAGYVTATPGAKAFDDPGIFRELPLVNQIRPRVRAWREADHPGVSGVTKKLLSHWHDVEQRNGRPFFFCQLEAMETLVWLTEAPASERVGIDIPSDGGNFARICTKMATGSGKTIVMSMVIAWQVLNKVAYPQDKRFSKSVFIVAPGLTVKSRLGVLAPGSAGNYYDLFNIVPMGLHDQMRQGKVMVRNWHTLMPLDPDAGPRVMKKGPESDEAFTRRVMEDLASAQNLLVINDEAHHAWPDPVDTAFSRAPKVDNRWNTVDFPALYCCCSEAVASAIVKDVFRITGASLADLLEAAYPQLVEIEWQGEPIDMTAESAIVLAGFSPDYPDGANHSQTQIVAITWHAVGASGVVCRSASMARLGFNGWSGDHAAWSELAIYTENCPTKPIVLNRRDDLGWL